jgi:hypothetical protein
MLASFQAAPDWPRAIRASLETVLERFASEPQLARLACFEVLAAGPVARERAAARMEAFAAVLAPGLQASGERPPRVLGALVAAGAFSLIQRHLASAPPASLPRLAPTLTFVVLTPFIGASRAARVAGGRTPAAPTTPRPG